MKALCLAAAVALLAGCASEPTEPDPNSRSELMQACHAQGGAYFEYENTSAGVHFWCVTKEGESITVEGDGNHD